MSAFQQFRTLGFKLGWGLGLSSLLATTTALATPDSVFEPVLEDIPFDAFGNPQAIRLPTVIPSDIELDPSVVAGRGKHHAMASFWLSPEPDCVGWDCTVLIIDIVLEPSIFRIPQPDLAGFPGSPEFYLEFQENGDGPKVNLGNGIQGYSSSWSEFGLVQWIQDDVFYALTYDETFFSEEEAIAMATSMVSGPPVTPP